MDRYFPGMTSLMNTLSRNAVVTGDIKPLEYIPCANCDVSRRWACAQAGAASCSACRLVSYCSQACQKQHWLTHKADCKNKLRSSGWKPAWVVEKRQPSFMSDAQGGEEVRQEWINDHAQLKHGLEKHLTGNMPAIDVLNLAKNEGTDASQRDFNLAFPASGDIRNLVRTVNELPNDYSGHLTVLLNDREPIVVARNLVLLMVLGMERDIPRAAELALHLWYSAFVQSSHPFTVLALIQPTLYALLRSESTSKECTVNIGPTSTLSASLSCSTSEMLTLLSATVIDYPSALKAYQDVFFDPSRADLHHRRFYSMEPSHRLAFQEFRLFGLVLPFGAPNASFNRPNRFLFSRSNQWLQNDGTSPFGSWEKQAVITAGSAHGAHRSDLFGCLYFYLSDQLRTFAERLQRFKVTIHILDQDALSLPAKIQSGSLRSIGLARTVRFDRIEMSNILDKEYAGIPATLSSWGPLLNDCNRCATLVGCLMNWPMHEHGGSVIVDSPNRTLINDLFRRMRDAGRLSAPRQGGMYETDIMNAMGACAAFYDNSSAFASYLKKQDTDASAARVGLKRKKNHTVVPRRLFAPLEGPPDALPYFADSEEWYLNVQISDWTLYERFVEFGPL